MNIKRMVVPLVLTGAAAGAGVVYRDTLVGWFRVGKAGDAATPAAAGHESHGAAPAATPADGAAAHVFPDAALEALRRAFDKYEDVRALLAADELAGVPDRARTVAGALREAGAAVTTAPAPLAEALKVGAGAADRLAVARDLAAARAAFGDVGRALVAAATADARLREGWHLFECPMATGYQKWLQRGSKLENPYMGQSMLTCGGASTWEAAPAAPPAGVSHDGHGHAGTDPAFYTCPMHPSVQQAMPGKCPICGMDLTPVTWDEKEGGVVLVDTVRRQQIGVRTGTVERGPMRLEIRAIGRVTWDETKQHDVTLKLQGWIRDLDVNATGQPVRKGQRLFTLYSPELYAAQQEYLLALRSRETSGDPARMDGLVKAAEARLRLWDLTPAQIRDLAKRGEPLEAVPFLSPASGFVVEKDVVAGAAVMPGQRLYRIASLDRVWVEADVYEADLPNVKVGQPATVTLSHQPGAAIEGRVAYVYPELDAQARTARVRIELPNPEGRLKPAMYATVALQADFGERLRIPQDAVLYTGPRRLVFVDLGEGRLRPQEVKLGQKADGHFEVLEGLSEGQTIVTSGNFLVAAESRIRSAATYWSEDSAGGGHAGH